MPVADFLNSYEGLRAAQGSALPLLLVLQHKLCTAVPPCCWRFL